MWEISVADSLPILKIKGTGSLKDINGRRRHFQVIEAPLVVQQNTYHEKAFVLQRIQFEDDGVLELRLGYYIIGKKPRMRGRWVWGQSCPLIPEGDFKKLIAAAEKRGWLGDDEDAHLAEVARQRMASFRLKDALTHEQVWGHLKSSHKKRPPPPINR